MLTEDYILRMINQALYALKKVLGLKTTGHYHEALAEIEKIIEVLLGLKFDLIKRLDDHSLIDALVQQGAADADRLYAAADLFREEADIREALQQPEEAFLSRARALNFFLEAARLKNLQHFSAPHDRIETLTKKIGTDNLPPATLYPLFCYYEDEGRYAEGELALNLLSRDADLGGGARQEQIGYYERLLEKSEAELARGGLERKQIQEKLAGLRRG